MKGCGASQFIPGADSEDKINLLQQGKYYGAPNAKRVAVHNDTRQCVWRSATEVGNQNYTAPLVVTPSSSNGIIEYQADHFDGQLRGNLIVSRYKQGLLRVILTTNGLGVIPQSIPPLSLIGDDGIDVTQAPNGNLIEVRLSSNALYYHKPNEALTAALKVKSVFPRRGGSAGGIALSIYGVNLNAGTGRTVTVGGNNCPIVSTTATRIDCTLPGGSGTVNVVVTSSAGPSTFSGGYRYIAGVGAAPPPAMR